MTNEERERLCTPEFRERARKRELDPFCDLCIHLHPTEDDQTVAKEHHMCLKHGIVVRPGTFHPFIMKCTDCIDDDSKEEI